MKTPFFILFLATSIAANGAITLIEDDWDTVGVGPNAGLSGGNNAALTAGVADPTGSGRGNVGSVNIGKKKADGTNLGTGPWGELRAKPNDVFPAGAIDVPASSVLGVDTFTMQADIYIPADTTFDTDPAATSANKNDRFNFIMRWNGLSQGAKTLNTNWSALAADTWHTLSLTSVLQETDKDGNAVTNITPIFSFYDNTNNAADGVAAYIDNVSVTVTTSAIPEPSVGVLGILGSLIFLRRRRH